MTSSKKIKRVRIKFKKRPRYTYKVKKHGKKHHPSRTRKKRRRTKRRKRRKRQSNIEVIRDPTPPSNKYFRNRLRHMIDSKLTPPRPFSPTINRGAMQLKTISPNLNILTCANKYQINITKKGRKKCVGWKERIVQKKMLDNLLSKKAIDCDNIVAPRQNLSNCWFNAFFMVFFISDMGRKFHRFLRQAMITSKLPGGGYIEKKLRWSFFLLNRYIEASLRGKSDPSRFAKLMDTNEIIRGIYRQIEPKQRGMGIVKTQIAANPLTYYISIMEYLGKGKKHFALSWITLHDRQYKTVRERIKEYILHRDAAPNMLFLEYSGTLKMKKERHIRVVTPSTDYHYSLDSAILRDTENEHFSAYITCNEKDYGFDGESFSRIAPFSWKSKLNEDERWRFAEQYRTYFNFTKGYLILLYYRV